jgi:DNA-binding transcriptional LysR family regulator
MANAGPVHASPFADADARIFVTVAHAGSFAAAAALARMTPSAVSKAVARLEGALGVKLLIRTTRALHLSEEGIAFRDRCERAFALLSEALEEVSTNARTVQGTVRIGAPPVFGTYLLPRVIARVRAEHPALRIEIVSTMRTADIVDRRLDFAIVVGPLSDSSFVARPLGYGQFVTVASPDYLARRGTPRRIEDLAEHACLVYTRPDGRDAAFVFKPDGDAHPPGAVAVRSDDLHHLAAMASAGVGIAQLPLFTVARELESGALVRLLVRWDPEPKLASLVFPAARSMPRRVRTVVEHLVRPESELPGATSRRS